MMLFRSENVMINLPCSSTLWINILRFFILTFFILKHKCVEYPFILEINQEHISISWLLGAYDVDSNAMCKRQHIIFQSTNQSSSSWQCDLVWLKPCQKLWTFGGKKWKCMKISFQPMKIYLPKANTHVNRSFEPHLIACPLGFLLWALVQSSVSRFMHVNESWPQNNDLSYSHPVVMWSLGAKSEWYGW